MTASRVLAVIPARGQSKRIPRKNLVRVGGLSLLERAILHCQGCYEADPLITVEVVVTTDDLEMASIAEQAGVRVVLRPAELAQDHSTTDDAVLHVLKELSPLTPDYVAVVQPTSPIRPPRLLTDCVHKLKSDPLASSILTAHKSGHFFWVRSREFGGYKQVNARNRPMSQDIKDTDDYLIENGAMYIIRTATLLATGARVTPPVVCYKTQWLPEVDTPEDLRLVRAMWAANIRGGN